MRKWLFLFTWKHIKNGYYSQFEKKLTTPYSICIKANHRNHHRISKRQVMDRTYVWTIAPLTPCGRREKGIVNGGEKIGYTRFGRYREKCFHLPWLSIKETILQHVVSRLTMTDLFGLQHINECPRVAQEKEKEGWFLTMSKTPIYLANFKVVYQQWEIRNGLDCKKDSHW